MPTIYVLHYLLLLYDSHYIRITVPITIITFLLIITTLYIAAVTLSYGLICTLP